MKLRLSARSLLKSIHFLKSVSFLFILAWKSFYNITWDKTLIIEQKSAKQKSYSGRLLKLCRSKPKKIFIQSAASYRFIFVHCGLEIILPPPGDSFYLDLSFSGRQIYNTRPFRRQRYATRPNRRDAQRINISLFSLIKVSSSFIVAWKSFCRPRATVFIWIYLSFSRPQQHFP